MKVALVQMEIKERNCAGNTEHGLTLLEEAAKQSDLVILPEIWTPASPYVSPTRRMARS